MRKVLFFLKFMGKWSLKFLILFLTVSFTLIKFFFTLAFLIISSGMLASKTSKY